LLSERGFISVGFCGLGEYKGKKIFPKVEQK